MLRQVRRITLLSDSVKREEVPRMKESLNLEGSVTAYSRIHCSGIIGAVIVDLGLGMWRESCTGKRNLRRLLRQHHSPY